LLAMVVYGYGIRSTLSLENQVYVSGAWTRANVLNRGPLGALYRVWQDGVVMDPTDTYGFSAEKLSEMGRDAQEKDSFISEGDTPTYLNLLDNGLRAQNGNWGGWGGIRREGGGPGGMVRQRPALAPDDPGIAPGLGPAGVKNPNIPDQLPSAPENRPQGPPRRPAPSPRTFAINNRFFAASQSDFAARLKWSVTPKYADANHEPVVTLKGPLNISAKVGSTVQLQGQTSDPDGNSVAVRWWQYNDAGSYPGDIAFSSTDSLTTSFVVPSDAKPGQTIHVILEGTDNGTPALTRYQRVVVTVAP
jgi:Protein of unknown function (DUF1593)